MSHNISVLLYAIVDHSDKPGQHDFEILRRLVLPDGSVLRAKYPGRPSRDCLFNDPVMDGKRYLLQSYLSVYSFLFLSSLSFSFLFNTFCAFQLQPLEDMELEQSDRSYRCLQLPRSRKLALSGQSCPERCQSHALRSGLSCRY